MAVNWEEFKNLIPRSQFNDSPRNLSGIFNPSDEFKSKFQVVNKNNLTEMELNNIYYKYLAEAFDSINNAHHQAIFNYIPDINTLKNASDFAHQTIIEAIECEISFKINNSIYENRENKTFTTSAYNYNEPVNSNLSTKASLGEKTVRKLDSIKYWDWKAKEITNEDGNLVWEVFIWKGIPLNINDLQIQINDLQQQINDLGIDLANAINDINAAINNATLAINANNAYIQGVENDTRLNEIYINNNSAEIAGGDILDIDGSISDNITYNESIKGRLDIIEGRTLYFDGGTDEQFYEAALPFENNALPYNIIILGSIIRSNFVLSTLRHAITIKIGGDANFHNIKLNTINEVFVEVGGELNIVGNNSNINTIASIEGSSTTTITINDNIQDAITMQLYKAYEIERENQNPNDTTPFRTPSLRECKIEGHINLKGWTGAMPNLETFWKPKQTLNTGFREVDNIKPNGGLFQIVGNEYRELFVRKPEINGTLGQFLGITDETTQTIGYLDAPSSNGYAPSVDGKTSIVDTFTGKLFIITNPSSSVLELSKTMTADFDILNCVASLKNLETSDKYTWYKTDIDRLIAESPNNTFRDTIRLDKGSSANTAYFELEVKKNAILPNTLYEVRVYNYTGDDQEANFKIDLLKVESGNNFVEINNSTLIDDILKNYRIDYGDGRVEMFYISTARRKQHNDYKKLILEDLEKSNRKELQKIKKELPKKHKSLLKMPLILLIEWDCNKDYKDKRQQELNTSISIIKKHLNKLNQLRFIGDKQLEVKIQYVSDSDITIKLTDGFSYEEIRTYNNINTDTFADYDSRQVISGGSNEVEEDITWLFLFESPDLFNPLNTTQRPRYDANTWFSIGWTAVSNYLINNNIYNMKIIIKDDNLPQTTTLSGNYFNLLDVDGVSLKGSGENWIKKSFGEFPASQTLPDANTIDKDLLTTHGGIAQVYVAGIDFLDIAATPTTYKVFTIIGEKNTN